MFILNNFITPEEQQEIISWAESYNPETKEIENPHIRKINSYLNGFSVLYNMTKTPISESVSRFQGDTTIVFSVPEIIEKIKNSIIAQTGFKGDHVFFQLNVMKAGGEVKPHYDAGHPGYVTMKCNISVKGPELDKIYVDKEILEVRERDMHGFEANFYKHWVYSDVDRIMLSYGFILPYEDLGWTEEDPRVKLSNRIWRNFIK